MTYHNALALYKELEPHVDSEVDRCKLWLVKTYIDQKRKEVTKQDKPDLKSIVTKIVNDVTIKKEDPQLHPADAQRKRLGYLPGDEMLLSINGNALPYIGVRMSDDQIDNILFHAYPFPYILRLLNDLSMDGRREPKWAQFLTDDERVQITEAEKSLFFKVRSTFPTECIHYSDCPKKLKCTTETHCNTVCGGHSCVHFACCDPQIVQETLNINHQGVDVERFRKCVVSVQEFGKHQFNLCKLRLTIENKSESFWCCPSGDIKQYKIENLKIKYGEYVCACPEPSFILGPLAIWSSATLAIPGTLPASISSSEISETKASLIRFFDGKITPMQDSVTRKSGSFEYKMSTEGGNCGSPLVSIGKQDPGMVIGIHAFGELSKNPTNRAIAFTSTYRSQIFDALHHFREENRKFH